MPLQVRFRLDKLLATDVFGLLAIRLNVFPFLPVVQHHLHGTPADVLTLAHQLGLLTREYHREQVEQVLRTSSLHTRKRFLLRLNGLAKELHLAPHVILQRPSYKLLHRFVPYTSMRHEEHHGLVKVKTYYVMNYVDVVMMIKNLWILRN